MGDVSTALQRRPALSRLLWECLPGLEVTPAGTLSGKVEGAGFQVVAKGQTFSANLNLVTRGANQSVTIKSQDAQADVRGATITLQRG